MVPGSSRCILLGVLAILLCTVACSTRGADKRDGGSPASSAAASAAASTAPSTASSTVTGPECGVPIAGRHRYLPISASRQTNVLLLGSGPRGVVVGAQANGGICQTLDYAQTLTARGYHVAVFDWIADYAGEMTTAARVLLTNGAREVVVGGFSRGALVGLSM